MNSDPIPSSIRCPSTVKITATGLNKHDADVSVQIQGFLAEHGIHDFSKQDIGSKVLVKAQTSDGRVVSLVFRRPEAKGGKFRRVSITRELVDLLELKEGCEIAFAVCDGKLLLGLATNSAGGGGESVPTESSSAVDTSGTDVVQSYPDLFERWFGRGSGSVKRPFSSEMGRPLGRILETPLLLRLRSLARDLVDRRANPRIVILAGGAGNGKSDALEEFLREIANSAGTLDLALPALIEAFRVGGRRVEFSASVLLPGQQQLRSVVVVQDATEGDDTGEPAGLLLANDLEQIVGSGDSLAVLCVNRGILEEARMHAETSGQVGALSILSRCTLALDPLCFDTDCWPLASELGAYLWPLDIASLAEGEPAILEQILEAISQSDWNSQATPEFSALGYNLSLISDGAIRKGIARLVRHHEVISGQRWTFRELFHLVAHFMTGGQLRRDGERLSDSGCRLSLVSGGSSEHTVATTMDTLRATIPQVLFPVFPAHDALRVGIEVIDSESGGSTLPLGKALLKYLEKQSDLARSVVESTLTNSWHEHLDPIHGMPRSWKIAAPDLDILESRVDGAFGTGVAAGIALLEGTGLLGPIEIAAMRLLDKVELELDSAVDGTVNPAAVGAWRDARCWIRRFANVIAKRLLCVRAGSGFRSDDASGFLAIIGDPVRLDAERRGVTTILEDGGSYIVPLSLSLGQPRGTAKEPPLLRVEAPRVKRGRQAVCADLRPSGVYREFQAVIQGGVSPVPIPYTIELYCRLRALDAGLLEGCLDGMSRGCLDQIRLALDGYAVRTWGREARLEIDLGEGFGRFGGFVDELDYISHRNSGNPTQ